MRVRRRGLALLVAAIAVAASVAVPRPVAAQRAPACGVERWPVKVLIDDDTARVNFVASPTTISALADLPEPRVERPQRRRLPLERRTFRVRAIILRPGADENDGDIHLIIADPADRNVTMIAEIPDPDCAIGSRHQAAYAAARRVVEKLPPGAEVELEGVAFWDRKHGQSGVAPNAIELHPVLKVTPIEKLGNEGSAATKRASSPADSSSVRVWLNLNSKVYHCPGTRYFGKTTRGEFMSQAEARRRGGRPSRGIPCR